MRGCPQCAVAGCRRGSGGSGGSRHPAAPAAAGYCPLPTTLSIAAHDCQHTHDFATDVVTNDDWSPSVPVLQAVFSIAKVDAATGEISGVFESVQPSDTDLGAKAPKDVKITGLWYAQLN